MVAADVPFKCEVDYLPKGWKSVLRRPAWAPTATPSEWSDWRISGEWGSVFVDGEDGYHLSVETRIEGIGSFMTDAPTWDDVQRRLHFCRRGRGLSLPQGIAHAEAGGGDLCRAWHPPQPGHRERQKGHCRRGRLRAENGSPATLPTNDGIRVQKVPDSIDLP